MSLIHLMTLGAGTPTRESIILQGSSGSPVTQTHLSLIPDEAVLVWGFMNTASIPNNIIAGKCQFAGYDEGDLAVYTTQHSWVTPNTGYTGDYWIRATNEGDGVSNTELDPTLVSSSALDTWYDATVTNIFWGWTHDGPIVKGGTVRIDIADAQPEDSNIIATGYYKGLVSAES